MKLFSAVLAITVVPLVPACTGGDDDDGSNAITWRVPCETHGHWTGGEDDTTRFTYDLRKHPTGWQTALADGTVTRTVIETWDLDHLTSVDYIGTSLDYQAVFAYAGDHLVRYQRTDRALDNGDDSYAHTYGYDDDGALIVFDIDYADPERDDRHTTITGNRSQRETDVECSVADPTSCDTYVWEQPDRDPEHWLAGTADYGTDGVLDYRWDRTIDSHGLDLTATEALIQPDAAAILQYRRTTEREPDGTSLGYTYDFFDQGGVVADTYVLASQFTCASSRPAAHAALRATPVLADDATLLPHRHRALH